MTNDPFRLVYLWRIFFVLTGIFDTREKEMKQY